MALSCKSLEVLALTITHGNNNNTEILARNALYLLNMVGRTDIPVYVGPSKPIMRPKRLGAPHVHGEGGFGDLDLSDFQIKEEWRQHKSAPQAIVDIVCKNKGDITLLTLGPLTNVAIAMQMEPRITEWTNVCMVKKFSCKFHFYHNFPYFGTERWAE